MISAAAMSVILVLGIAIVLFLLGILWLMDGGEYDGPW